jgi:hypothetical protein
MTNIAILAGNAFYKQLSRLDCCGADVAAMKELLEATGKYAHIHIIEDTDADDLKSRMRDALDRQQPTEEVFFYFSGHGFQNDSDSFLCATNFDDERPNETGLSNTELHELLRLADANLVVRVVDACSSGVRLLKSNTSFLRASKAGFRNVIEISSCLDVQDSLTGDPLSPFTDAFRLAVMRKEEGPVYYTDIINTLRDDFHENEDQTPYYAAQGTAREKFVEDASCFAAIKAALAPVVDQIVEAAPAEVATVQNGEQSLLAALEAVEARIVKPERLHEFVSKLFDGLQAALTTNEFARFFDTNLTEHADFQEPTARAHIIRVLNRETRPDDFVTATITRKSKRRDPFGLASTFAQFAMMGADEDVVETFDLELNCTMERAQLKMTLTPKYSALKRVVLVVTCAPSLSHCYVFEIGTSHDLVDFGKFNSEGHEMVRNWYKPAWSDDPTWLVKRIVENVTKVVRGHIESTAKRISKDDAA